MRYNPQTNQFTTANGMTLSKSRTNPKSRYSKIVGYIRNHPAQEATRAEVTEQVFGKIMKRPYPTWNVPNEVSTGWGSYVWSLMVAYGDLVKTRKGNKVFYSLPITK